MEKFKTVVTLISAVLIPLVVAFLGNNYTRALKEREIQAQFVKIAVDILQSQPSPHNRNVREWATEIINRYSGVPLSPEAKRDLIEKVSISTVEFGQEFAQNLSSNDIVKAQEELRILGFYTGTITGIADEATIKAIIDFQETEKIPADGSLGPLTQNRLHKRTMERTEHK